MKQKKVTKLENELNEEISNKLPEFKQMVGKAFKEESPVLLHQDSFAADYQQDEYKLLGKAIKFAGMVGVEVIMVGSNRETLDKKKGYVEAGKGVLDYIEKVIQSK